MNDLHFSTLLVTHGMVWYGMVWYGMVWYGMIFRVLLYHSFTSKGLLEWIVEEEEEEEEVGSIPKRQFRHGPKWHE